MVFDLPFANAIIVGVVPFLSNDISSAGRGKPSAAQITSNGSPSTITKEFLYQFHINHCDAVRDDVEDCSNIHVERELKTKWLLLSFFFLNKSQMARFINHS